MKNNKTTDKITNLALAAGAGVGTKFILAEVQKYIDKANAKKADSIKIDPRIIAAAPLVGAFFLLDVKGMEAAAYGICGAAGVSLGHEFGLYGINKDDINGMFVDDPLDVTRNNKAKKAA